MEKRASAVLLDWNYDYEGEESYLEERLILNTSKFSDCLSNHFQLPFEVVDELLGLFEDLGGEV